MKSIKNKTASTVYILGQEHVPNVWQEIPTVLEGKYASSESFLAMVLSGDFVVSANNSTELSPSSGIRFLLGNPNVDSEGNTMIKAVPFASKSLGGKALFKRVHGIQNINVVGLNTLEFVIPYAFCKITGVELIGGVNGDRVDFAVHDTPTGTLSGYPNAKLNQFGFSVCIAEGFYAHTSEYESDLPQNLKVVVKYTATTTNVIGINFILNELK